MTADNLQRLLFRQKGLCFFCQKDLSIHRADIEHLLAASNTGPDRDENLVAVCKGANRLMANLPLKEKINIFREKFTCPEEKGFSCIQDSSPDFIKGVADKVDQYVNILKANKISRPALYVNIMLSQLILR